MGHCRGGLTKKIHALVDAERRPIRFKLTLGQAGGAPVGTELVPDPAPGAPPDRRPRQRHQPDPRRRRLPRHLGRHPAPRNPQGRFQLQLASLSATQPRGALLQPHQAVPRPRHSLCPQTGQLPGRPHARSHSLLDCVHMSPPPRPEARRRRRHEGEHRQALACPSALDPGKSRTSRRFSGRRRPAGGSEEWPRAARDTQYGKGCCRR